MLLCYIMKKLFGILLLPMMCSFSFCSRVQQSNGFQKNIFIIRNDSLLYQFYTPFQSEKINRPLVIFLHGAGERGNDNEKQLRNGVRNFVSPENQKKYPCFVLAPQCPIGQRWVEVDFHQPYNRQPAEISKPLRLLMELIDSLINHCPVDRQRIYVTGLSMGGFGTWDLIERYPAFFAAAVPVCGGGDELLANKLIKVPIWAFHGKLDEVVTPARSENMIKAIQNAGGHPLYTGYPDMGHACWEETYSDPVLFKWLFHQKMQLP